ncbi:hypothetical protein I4U23_020830 [Adineta vaga]|nr:hypothetical protein I4U23_020830 [Adineta vaga]
MDESHQISLIKHSENIITFNENILSNINGHDDECVSEEFAKYFSIDNDDIVLLDQSQIILYEVKTVIDRLINQILNRENHERQINRNHCEDSSLHQSVRSTQSDDKQQALLTSIFVSETIQSSNQSTSPYTQFLYHLGFDLCLEQNLNEQNSLTEIQKQTLLQRNQVFHQHRIYTCKHCSFKTDTIHALKYHYLTPHILPNFDSSHHKYHCIYCSFQTFRIPALRRHYGRKHGYQLIPEHSLRRYTCTYCYYESDDKNNFRKHNKRCEIEQTRTRIANNLLAPSDQLNKTNTINQNQSVTKKIPQESIANILQCLNNDHINEPILIESDHDPSSISSSDEDFIVSSDEESFSSIEEQRINNRDLEIVSESRPKQMNSKSTSSLSSSVPSSTSASSTLSSLSKLLLLNATSISSFTPSALNLTKSSLISIQPKPTTLADTYQMCNLCQCYIYTKDYLKHMNEKHQNSLPSTSQTVSTPIPILNNTTNSMNPTITNLTPTLIITKTTPQLSSAIFLLSTTAMNSQSIILNMIKCPWCDTNYEHIDIITGHLMRYHRMTLAAAKVVVAEQMKIQGTSSGQLASFFKKEIEQIQKEFIDKIYWKISQPKVYLHQIETISCYMCQIMVDDLENHFLTLHQIQLATMNTTKQCCLCGFKCDQNKYRSLFEHQLRTHTGVCYSNVLKQFIRFEPPPSPVQSTISKDNDRLILPTSSSTPHGRALVTHTEKKFGCRKCDTSSRLFTFEELVEHLCANHDLNVKLHRRCIICHETYMKGKEYNQHCLEHLKDENPSIKIKRQRII